MNRLRKKPGRNIHVEGNYYAPTRRKANGARRGKIERRRGRLAEHQDRQLEAVVERAYSPLEAGAVVGVRALRQMIESEQHWADVDELLSRHPKTTVAAQLTPGQNRMVPRYDRRQENDPQTRKPEDADQHTERE